MNLLLVIVLGLCWLGTSVGYEVGIGIADCTGPPVEVTFMGYGQVKQKGSGLHLRQFGRSFIFDDGNKRVVFVSVDVGMMGHIIREKVIEELKHDFGELYTFDNVMLSGTHTHSAPGGFLGHLLFDLPSLGFVRQTYEALTTCVVNAIVRAHHNMKPARLFLKKGDLVGANINRSPQSYAKNPPEERDRYSDNVDHRMLQLEIASTDGQSLGCINWFAVHPVSMNNTNTLVSSDNVGLASITLERKMNPKRLIGKGPFICAFASTNLGDVSPNILGPKCQKTGESCNNLHSTCPDNTGPCIASGPGKDMYESTQIIADKLVGKAMELLKSSNRQEITGEIRFIHQFVNMPKQNVTIMNQKTGKEETYYGCKSAMGHAFGAGTTDGPGVFLFQQGAKSQNPLWNTIRDLIADTPDNYIKCHYPKPILLATGQMGWPVDWQPQIVPTQIALLGSFAMICVPGEFTTMSGRRMRNEITDIMKNSGLQNPETTIVGLCNEYSDYITTPEEYQVQRYEGASTIYGPYTLPIYLKQYRNLMESLLNNTDLEQCEIKQESDCSLRTVPARFIYSSIFSYLQKRSVDEGPHPPVLLNDLISLQPPVVYDTPQLGHEYGDVILQPNKFATYGDVVTTKMIGANLRNCLKHDETYLTVEMRDGDNWLVVKTDADWETKIHWIRTSQVLGNSEVRIEVVISEDMEPGYYRIRHFGCYKYIFGGVFPYEATTRTFKVTSG